MDQQSQFDSRVFGAQVPYLKEMYGKAGNLFDQSSGQMQQMAPGLQGGMADNIDRSTPFWQNQMAGGSYRDMGLQDNLMSSLNRSLDNPSAMQDINSMIMGGSGNNYADAMKNQYMQDADRAQELMLSNTDARAAASGMSGGSRHGIAQGLGMEGINDQLQTNLANTGYQTFDKDLDRKLQIAQQADQGTLARQGMMQGMLGNMQSTQNLGLGGAGGRNDLQMDQMAPTMAPWQAMGQYSGAIGAPQVLSSGSSMSTSDSKSGGGGLL